MIYLQKMNENLEICRSKMGKTKKSKTSVHFFLWIFFFAVLHFTARTMGNRIITHGGTIFKRENNVAFSESSWTISTILKLDSTDTFIKEITDWLQMQEKMLQNSDHVFRRRLREQHFLLKAKASLKTIEDIKRRSSNIKDILVSGQSTESVKISRKKRSMFDAGGSALQWLFGVSTQNDLNIVHEKLQSIESTNSHIVHVLKLQASAVNESLWENKLNALAIQGLEERYSKLIDMVQQVSQENEKKYQNLQENFDIWLQLDSMFDCKIIYVYNLLLHFSNFNLLL